MSQYDDDDREEFRQAMSEYGFDDVEDEDDLQDAVQELAADLEQLPERVLLLIDFLRQGHDLADAAYYAGYGKGTQGLHKVLKKDTGENTKEKLFSFRQVHLLGKEKVDTRRASRTET